MSRDTLLYMKSLRCEWAWPAANYGIFEGWYRSEYGEREMLPEGVLDKDSLANDLMREYYAYRGLEWLDDIEGVWAMVELVLSDRMGYHEADKAPSALRYLVFEAVDGFCWEKRRVRRKPIPEGKHKIVARTIYRDCVLPRISKEEALAAENRRNVEATRTIQQDNDSRKAYSDELHELLRKDAWRTWTYNEAARETGTGHEQARISLRWLAAQPWSDVVALRKSGKAFVLADLSSREPSTRATHFAYRPARRRMRQEGRAFVLCSVAREAVRRNPGSSTRALRTLVRDFLGGVKARDVDLALGLLERVGAAVRAERGERKAARWSLAPLEAAENARAAAELRELTRAGFCLDGTS